MIKGCITGIGIAVPSRLITNQHFEEILDTTNEWIVQRTGIEQRFFCRDETNADLAIKAAQNALQDAHIESSDLDHIIVATSTPDYLCFPSQSSLVQKGIGAINSSTLDINTACSGFTSAIDLAFQRYQALNLSENKKCNYLVIGVDCLSKYLDLTDRSSAVVFGDGAGAVVLQAEENGSGIYYTKTMADGTKADLITCDPTSRRIHMNGRAVYELCMKILPEFVEQEVKNTPWSLETLDHFVFHQANKRMVEALAKRLHLPEQKVFTNISQYGNTSAASIPIALYGLQQTGNLHKGDVVALIGFGAGFSWGINILKWP